MDTGEDAAGALQREMQEEFGCQVIIDGIVGTAANRYPYGEIEYRTCDIGFACRLPDGAMLTPADDVADYRWVPRDELAQQPWAFESITLIAQWQDWRAQATCRM